MGRKKERGLTEEWRDGWELLFSNALTPLTGSLPLLLDVRVKLLLPPYVIGILDSCSTSLYFERK